MKCEFWTPDSSGYQFCELAGMICNCNANEDNCEPEADEIKDNGVAVLVEEYQDNDQFHPNRNR